MNAWTREIERLRAENERLFKEANINIEELCKLREREKGYLSELKDYAETVERLRRP